MRVTRLVLALLVVGCADDLALSPSFQECTASNEAVGAYVARVAGLASNRAHLEVLERNEQVTVSFAIAADGSASEFRADRAGRPAATQEVLRAAAAASPYPRPPFDPKACLVGGRATIWMIGYARCDETRANAYTHAIATRIQQAVADAGITAPQREKVTLRVKVDRQGAASAITVQDASTAEIGERVAVVARKLSPFEAPGDSIAQCVSDRPFFLWIQLPAETRPPIRDR